MRYFSVLMAVAMLAGCGDPTADILRLSQADVADDAPILGVMPKNSTEIATETPAKTPTLGGLFAQLLSGELDGDAQDELASEAEPPTPIETAHVEEAALPSKTPLLASAETASQTVAAAAFTPDIVTPGTVTLGTALPYGQIARICDLPKRAFGTKIAQYPENRPRHTLYDSDPGTTQPHTFYLDGFDDGCARQFTASLAVFGSVGMHEQLRYGLPAEVQPYSDTDKAYEKLKGRVCRVPTQKPCGAKLRKLEGDTVFLSIYESFGGNARWSNLLLHEGQLLAQDIKG